MLGNDLLVGSADIAERLGFKRLQNVYYYIDSDPTFPAPLDTIRGAKIWSWPEVEAWARTKDFRQHRPAEAPRSKDFQAAMERLAGELGLAPEQSEDLIGAYEIGVRLGLDDTMIVHDWMRTEGTTFPRWVQRVGPAGGTFVWMWPDVEKWAEDCYPDQIKAWRRLRAQRNGSAPTANGTAAARPTAETAMAKNKQQNRKTSGTGAGPGMTTKTAPPAGRGGSRRSRNGAGPNVKEELVERDSDEKVIS